MTLLGVDGVFLFAKVFSVDDLQINSAIQQSGAGIWKCRYVDSGQITKRSSSAPSNENVAGKLNADESLCSEIPWVHEGVQMVSMIVVMTGLSNTISLLTGYYLFGRYRH